MKKDLAAAYLEEKMEPAKMHLLIKRRGDDYLDSMRNRQGEDE